MGMYNEVFKQCPSCGEEGYLQIAQIVKGFGGFNLDDPKSIAESLTSEQIIELHDKVKDKWFDCKNCETSFQLHHCGNTKIDLAMRLFTP